MRGRILVGQKQRSIFGFRILGITRYLGKLLHKRETISVQFTVRLCNGYVRRFPSGYTESRSFGGNRPDIKDLEAPD